MRLSGFKKISDIERILFTRIGCCLDPISFFFHLFEFFPCKRHFGNRSLSFASIWMIGSWLPCWVGITWRIHVWTLIFGAFNIRFEKLRDLYMRFGLLRFNFWCLCDNLFCLFKAVKSFFRFKASRLIRWFPPVDVWPQVLHRLISSYTYSTCGRSSSHQIWRIHVIIRLLLENTYLIPFKRDLLWLHHNITNFVPRSILGLLSDGIWTVYFIDLKRPWVTETSILSLVSSCGAWLLYLSNHNSIWGNFR